MWHAIDMKALVKTIYHHPRYTRFFEWGRLVTMAGSAQLLIHAIGFISGILVIRFLPSREYALYTLSNTMLAVLIILADGGIASGVMSQGGKVWQDRKRLGVVLATGLDLRKKFAIGSLLIATPVLVFLLRHHGADWVMCILIVAALIPAFVTALNKELLEIVHKLHQNIFPLQKIAVVSNTARLVMLSVSIVLMPFAFIAILVSGISQVWANKRIQVLSDEYAMPAQKPDQTVRKNILVLVKRHLPSAIYYCLSGQITIWLISFFGTTSSVAQIGALSRIAMLLGILSILFGTLILPRFARMIPDVNLLLSSFLRILAGLIVVNCLIVGLVWMFSTQILWILGPSYQNLELEVVLLMIGSCLNMIAEATSGLYMSRGWVIHPVILISMNVATIVCGVTLINVTTLQGVLMFNIFVSAINVFINTIYSVFFIIKRQQDAYV